MFRSAVLVGWVLSLVVTTAHCEDRTTVFRAGKGGYKIYRIPTIVRAANGDLLAFCEARSGGDASDIDLVLKRSKDQGKTWGKLKIVQKRQEFAELYPGRELTVGNPVPVVDLLDSEHPGRIWVPFTVENDRVFVIHSDDHGDSWSKPREITESVKLPSWGWYAPGPVHSIQLERGPHRGRLVVPSDHRIGDQGADRGPTGAHVFFSDDHGKTWQLGAIDDTYDDGLNANETTAVELIDGRVYFNTRSQQGDAPSTRGDAYSGDGGENFVLSGNEKYKWFVPSHPVLDPPVVQSALLRAAAEDRGDGRNVILFSGPDNDGPSGPGRSDLRIRYSLDETKTWQDGPLLHEGPAAYSDLVRLTQDGDEFGVLFECGDAGKKSSYQRIDFIRFPLSSVLDN